jgi:hypothetical protein
MSISYNLALPIHEKLCIDSVALEWHCVSLIEEALVPAHEANTF